MSKDINSVKGYLQKSLSVLSSLAEEFPKDQIRKINMRIQLINNTVLENEKKIWIRTKQGKEIISELNNEAARFFDVLDNYNKEASLDSIKSKLVKMEKISKKITEEIRKRSMVVT